MDSSTRPKLLALICAHLQITCHLCFIHQSTFTRAWCPRLCLHAHTCAHLQIAPHLCSLAGRTSLASCALTALACAHLQITPLLGILGVLARQHNSTHASNTTPQPQPRKEADIELGQALGRKPEGDMREPPLVRSKANDHTVLKSRDKVRGHSDTDGCTEVDNPKYNSPGRTAVQAPEAAGHRAWCTLPHVYLVHCCRHLEELQLLDTQLLQAACRWV
eukprot:1159136-Pelagomonas_calceolata.AAC.9